MAMAACGRSAFTLRSKMFLFAAFYLLSLSACFAKSPNIVFVLTDDQDTEVGGQIPIEKIRNLVGKEGITFQNMFVSSPLCCPSRSSIVTGKYVHNHHAANNSLNGGCSSDSWQKEQEPTAFPVHLKKAGYNTMFAGKYLNQYGTKPAGGVAHVPPGWDEWIGLVGNSKYYNYDLSINGKLESHGNNYERDYFTNYINNKAEKFLSKQTADSPFFMMLATPACHQPFTPADPYVNNFADHQAPRNGSFNVKAKNKHWLIQQAIVPMPDNSITFIDNAFRNRWRTLLSVDDMMENLYNMLKQKDMLDDTYIFFSSDNGYHLGQFGLPYDKRQLYEFDVRVPLMIRGPGIKAGQITQENAMNIDLGPTFIALSGQQVPSYMDGQPLIPVWSAEPNRTRGSFRSELLVEHYGEHNPSVAGCPQYNNEGMYNCDPNCVCEDSWNNTFSCVRSDRPPHVYKYCIMKDNVNFVEAYELTGDRHEFENIATTGDPTLMASLKDDLMRLESCSGTLCHSP
ncbi:N-acetylglucosamine-6-sulfatase-like [Littorina saxatilis]|uniref:Sulfatase N-terminal domain-containing protein n=1 Tax=Littorina saxatilis TaxID=31220 RepID=A0AAN9G9I0_9CAEN